MRLPWRSTAVSEPAPSTLLVPRDTDDRLDRLCDIIVSQGLCDARSMERGRRIAEETGQRIDAVLIQLGLVTERGLASSYAELLDIPLTSPARFPAEPLFADRLTSRFLRHARALPLALEGDRLVVAVADPLNRFTPAAIAAAIGCKVAIEIAVPIELEAAFERLYPDAAEENAEGDADAEASEEDAERLKDLASEAPVIRLVSQIISRAVETQASDIHLEPFEDRLRVRYRHDGVLHEVDSQPARLIPAIISRVKIMSKLDIAERRLPQDGRIKLPVRGQDIDFRVSTIPSLHGETVVLRILDRGTVALDYDALGLAPAVVQRLNRALHLPNGIVLVTGPTGSGKTTTLYTGIIQINSIMRKIVTVEDPIEYQIPGITQTQVKPQIGLTFAHVLRSILRQDPNVVMIGEIRDLETAQIAVNGALTGRLVLSTLHTNSAASSITRLRDMGLEDYLITAVLRGVLAQRLVRRLCPECRVPVAAAPELVRRFDLERRCDGGPMTLWRPVGCSHCRETGYRGRQAIAEFLLPDERIERLIFSRADQSDIEQAAVEAGMVTMFEAGVAAALSGTTTLEEVVRTLRGEA
ncbi:MAG: Flp pilus assembly complex ATPase component TadA [Proteobacteria bacterium]|nr:Flp pilus assembly complex ATPase component TadA [Pseudomonadota bacterium]